jgi:tetratricopeptide (TPR) repeat protein
MPEQNMIINGKEIEKEEPRSKKKFDIKQKFFGSKKKKIVFGLIVLLLLTIGVVSLLVYTNGRNKSEDVAVVIKPSDKNVAAENAAYKSKDKYEDKLKSIDSTYSSSADKKDQAASNLYKSSVALNAQQYNDALKFAQAAEALEPTLNSAQLIATSAQKLNQKQLAIEYYKKAIDRLPTVSAVYTAAKRQADADKYLVMINQVNSTK